MDDETRLLLCPFCGNETAPKICSAEEVLDAMQPPTA